ncbi:MAG: tetratricopeptide repeat protein [Bacteroidaceae bacterium]|nr:tetratricopeptide repeat protein [Bacteroidaceae bacterium]
MSAENLFKNAEEACKHRLYTKAKSLLNTCITVYGEDDDVYCLLGQIANDEGDDNLAVDYLTEALKLNPENIQALLLKGKVCGLQRGKLEVAKKYFNTVLELEPDNHVALCHLATVLREEKDYDKAVSLFQKGINLDEGDLSGYAGLAQTYFDQGMFQEAFDTAVEGANNGFATPEITNAHEGWTKILKETAEILAKQVDYEELFLDMTKEIADKWSATVMLVPDKSLTVGALLEGGQHHDAENPVIRYNEEVEYYEHAVAHELGHLQMYLAAERTDNMTEITRTPKTDSVFEKKFGAEMREKLAGTMPDEQIEATVKQEKEALIAQFTHDPLNLFVEQYLYDNYPTLRPMQFWVLIAQIRKAVASLKEERERQPVSPKAFSARKVLHAVAALHFRELFGIDLFGAFKCNKKEEESAEHILQALRDDYETYVTEDKPGHEIYFLDFCSVVLDTRYIFWLNFPEIPEEEGPYDYDEKADENDEEEYDEVDDDDESDDEDDDNGDSENKGTISLWEVSTILAISDALDYFAEHSSAEVTQMAKEMDKLFESGIDPDDTEHKYNVPSMPDKKDMTGEVLLANIYTAWKLVGVEIDEQWEKVYAKVYEDAQTLFAEHHNGQRCTLDD